MSFFRTFENVKKLILIFDIHVKENATSKTNQGNKWQLETLRNVLLRHNNAGLFY